MENASTVCVLIGSGTAYRPWVKYEIARSVIDGRGLLGVHINGLNHHQRKALDWLGKNPIENMGIFKNARNEFYLYERKVKYSLMLGLQNQFEWVQYRDYVQQVKLPRYLKEPSVGYVMPLSAGTSVYDYVNHVGHKNIGAWIDLAAKAVGR